MNQEVTKLDSICFPPAPFLHPGFGSKEPFMPSGIACRDSTHLAVALRARDIPGSILPRGEKNQIYAQRRVYGQLCKYSIEEQLIRIPMSDSRIIDT